MTENCQLCGKEVPGGQRLAAVVDGEKVHCADALCLGCVNHFIRIGLIPAYPKAKKISVELIGVPGVKVI